MTIPKSSDAFENFYPKNVVRNPSRFAVPQLSLKSTLPTQLRITFDVAVATSDAAVVVLNVALNDIGWSVEGTSKRDPADKPDRELGLLLATQRALQKLTNQIGRQTSGRVEHNDNMRAQRYQQVLKDAKETPVEANIVEMPIADPTFDGASWMDPNAPTIVFNVGAAGFELATSHGIDEVSTNMEAPKNKKVSKRKQRKRQKAAK